VGCGGGDETVMIAKKVGVTGRVTAIDISAEQIGIARENIKNEKLTNVDFKVLAAEDLNELKEKFDLAYCRMVLVHVKNPKIVLQYMKNCVVNNGLVACEEPDISSCFSVPKSEAFEKHIHLLCEFIKKNDCDPDLGSKMYKIFHDIGFSQIDICFFQPAITDKRLRLAAPLSAKSCKPQYVALGLITESKADNLIHQITKEVVDPEHVLLGQCRMTQIYGIK
jgi:SAM-dependent methyltransferase